jgi:hypothetical protein
VPARRRGKRSEACGLHRLPSPRRPGRTPSASA